MGMVQDAIAKLITYFIIVVTLVLCFAAWEYFYLKDSKNSNSKPLPSNVRDSGVINGGTGLLRVDWRDEREYCNGNDCPLFRNLVITSKVDAITLNEIIVNRGNCYVSYQLPYYGSVPTRNLRFGENTSYRLPSECVPLEVEIHTNQGNFKFKFRTTTTLYRTD